MPIAEPTARPAPLAAVTINAYARKPLLAREGALDLFRVTLVYYRPQLRFAVFGFAGLADHLHLLLRPSASLGIERTLREIKASYSRKYHQFYRRHGSVWQPKYFVREVRAGYAVLPGPGRPDPLAPRIAAGVGRGAPRPSVAPGPSGPQPGRRPAPPGPRPLPLPGRLPGLTRGTPRAQRGQLPGA